MLKMTLF